MPYKNLEDRRKWNARNADKNKQYKERYQLKHKARLDAEKEKRKQETQNRRALAQRERNARRAAARRQPGYVSRESQIRARDRAMAIAKMGGKCMHCGFDDARALQFDHIIPVLRRLNGVSRNRAGSHDSYKEVLDMPRPAEKFQLLCANCHVIKTKENGEYAGRSIAMDHDAPDLPQMPLFALP